MGSVSYPIVTGIDMKCKRTKLERKKVAKDRLIHKEQGG